MSDIRADPDVSFHNSDHNFLPSVGCDPAMVFHQYTAAAADLNDRYTGSYIIAAEPICGNRVLSLIFFFHADPPLGSIICDIWDSLARRCIEFYGVVL